MPSFLGGKSPGSFGQPVLALAGNRMTIVAFKKEISLKSIAKRLFDSIEVLNLRKKRNICKLKEKVEGEKFKFRKLPSKDFIFQFVFFTTESLPCSEPQPSK